MLPAPAKVARQTRARGRLNGGGLVGGAGVVWVVAACATAPTPIEQAALLSQKGQETAAIAVLDRYLEEHPRAIAERRVLIRLLGASADVPRAQREAGRLATLLPPDSPVPWIELGHLEELGHRYEEALSMYDRAAEVAPRDPAGPRTGGMRAARWGELEVAAPRLEEALRRDSRAADVWHALGLVRLRLGDRSGAAKAYESGLVADPGALENRIGLATVALEEHRPADALRQYDAVLGLRPSFGDGYLGRAWALIELGRFDAARASLEEARRHGADTHVIDRQYRLLTLLANRARAAEKPR